MHRGDGNPSNLLLCPNEDYEELFEICLIDNTTTCIKAEKGRKRYMDLVEKVFICDCFALWLVEAGLLCPLAILYDSLKKCSTVVQFDITNCNGGQKIQY